jgi:hypothetical protein
MKVKGRGISLTIATILASLPILLFSVGICDFLKLSLFWYALLAPWESGVALYGLINIRLGAGYRWMYVFGFASAFLCWFAFGEGVRALSKRETSKAWLQGFSWSILYLVLYGFGAWFLWCFWHAP